MGLGRAGCAAAAITAGAAAEQNDDVSGLWTLAHNLTAGRRAYYSADFKAFCHIAGMVYLFDKTGRKAIWLP